MNEKILLPGNYHITFKSKEEVEGTTIGIVVDHLAIYNKGQIPSMGDKKLFPTSDDLIQNAYEKLPAAGESEKLPLADYKVTIKKV